MLEDNAPMNNAILAWRLMIRCYRFTRWRSMPWMVIMHEINLLLSNVGARLTNLPFLSFNSHRSMDFWATAYAPDRPAAPRLGAFSGSRTVAVAGILQRRFACRGKNRLRGDVR